MPNFNGAIVMHTLQSLKTPATLREIVVTIAKHTNLSSDDLKLPVKQTLDMGEASGFLQKLNGRYFLVPMTFANLMSDMKNLDYDQIEDTSILLKKLPKKQKCGSMEQDLATPSTTTLMPSMARSRGRRSQTCKR